VVDSGTTFTYLPTSAFNKFSRAVGDYALAHGLQSTEGADPQVRGSSGDLIHVH